MKSHEDDETYENLYDNQPKRTKHTKFRGFDDKDDTIAKWNKRFSKRSHRQKTIKDDIWPDDDD